MRVPKSRSLYHLTFNWLLPPAHLLTYGEQHRGTRHYEVSQFRRCSFGRFCYRLPKATRAHVLSGCESQLLVLKKQPPKLGALDTWVGGKPVLQGARLGAFMALTVQVLTADRGNHRPELTSSAATLE